MANWEITVAYKWTTIALVLWGCSSKESAPPPPAPAKQDAAVEVRPPVGLTVHRFDTPPVELPLHKSFTLLAPGEGAKHTLRYELAAEPVSHFATTTLTSRRLAKGTWDKPKRMPPVKNGLAFTPGAPGSPLAVRVLPGTLVGRETPEALQYLTEWKALEGRRLTIAVDPRGTLGKVTFTDDPDTKRSATERDEIVQRMLATLVPVPEEPVGTGAHWRVVTVLRQRPAVVKQTATYTLRAVEDDRWTVDVDIRRIGESQLLLDPDLPAHAAVELVALVRELRGTLTVDRSQVLPTGKLTVSSTIHVRARTPTSTTEEIVEDTGSVVLESAR